MKCPKFRIHLNLPFIALPVIVVQCLAHKIRIQVIMPEILLEIDIHFVSQFNCLVKRATTALDAEVNASKLHRDSRKLVF
jgi:hypothetical protein